MKTYFRPDVKIPESQFPIEQFIEYKEDTYDVLGSVFLDRVQDSVNQISEIEVLENECRFDSISNKYMGSSDFWWLIMEYNNYIDWNIKGNNKLKIPDSGDLLKFKQELVLRHNLNLMNK